MQGRVFGLLERLVVDSDGDDAWDDLLEAAGWDGVTSPLRRYDDALFLGLLAEATGTTHDPEQGLRWFGHRAAGLLLDAPAGALPSTPPTVDEQAEDVVGAIRAGVEEVVLRLGGHDIDVVATAPLLSWHEDPLAPWLLALGYDAADGRCALVDGVVSGVARVHGRVATVVQPKCTHRGSGSCLLLCDLTGAARAAR